MAQADAFEPILSGDDVVLAHASGTGKSVAFLAPLLDQLWKWEAAEGRTPPGQVRAVVLVPNAELGQQLLETVRSIASRSIRASLATGEHSWQTQRARLEGGTTDDDLDRTHPANELSARSQWHLIDDCAGCKRSLWPRVS